MKKVEKLKLEINYIGITDPETTEEVELEVAGLKTAISSIYTKIAVLEQSLKLQSFIEAAKNAKNIKAPNSEAK